MFNLASHLSAATGRQVVTQPPNHTDVSYLAGPLDPVINFIKPWSTGLLVLGAIILGLCMVWVAIKMGARAAASKKNEGGAIRDSIGMAVGVGVAGVVLGAALIVVALAVKFGQGVGTVG